MQSNPSDLLGRVPRVGCWLGGGGLHYTTEYYVRFAHMLLNSGEYDRERIISEATLDAMNQKFIGDKVNRDAFFFRAI